MLSKCANPACTARFRYLREGRIFNLEIKTLASNGSGRLSCKIEHFWLCDSCAEAMEVIWQNGVVSTRPLQPMPSTSKSEDETKVCRRTALSAGAGS
jgi:hypothetical protein